MHTTPTPPVPAAELDEYLTDYPRTGVTLKVRLDGSKARRFDQLVMPRWIGCSGLLTRTGSMLRFDAADLPELIDAVVCALGDEEDRNGVRANLSSCFVALLNRLDALSGSEAVAA